jgi:hydroxymethylbilane synthase
VHGCADGLGEQEAPRIDALAGRAVSWLRLTHQAAAADGSALATYVVDQPLPDDLPTRRAFFWTSGSQCREAIGRWPALRERQHHCGPGRTSREVVAAVGSSDRVRVWLDYDEWRQEMWE